MRALRIAALVVLIAGVAATIWLFLGAPGIAEDVYYAAAKARQGLPFAAATAAVALLVFLAGGTSRSRRRWAALGLWLTLIGALLLAVAILGELAIPSTHPHGYAEFGAAYLRRLQLLMLAATAGGLSLLSGGVLWLLSYRLDRVRDAS